MIGRAVTARMPNFPTPPMRYEPAAMHGLGGGFVPAGLGSTAMGTTACPNCGTPVPRLPAPAGVGFGTAMFGSVASMTLAGLLTHAVSKRLLGW